MGCKLGRRGVRGGRSDGRRRCNFRCARTIPRESSKPIRRRAIPTWVKFVVLGLGLTYFAVFLLLPLAAVFVEAFRKGVDTYFMRARRTRCAFGNSADAAGGGAFRAAQSSFRPGGGVVDREVSVSRQEFADHVHRSAVLGLARGRRSDLRSRVRPAGLVRAMAARARHQNHLRSAGHCPGDDIRHVSVHRT